MKSEKTDRSSRTNRKPVEQSGVHISERMLQSAEEQFIELERRYKGRKATLNAKKADCLSRLIRGQARGMVTYTPHEIALAQAEFKELLKKRERDRVKSSREEQRALEKEFIQQEILRRAEEEYELEKEHRRMSDLDDRNNPSPGSNHLAGPMLFSPTQAMQREAEMICRIRHDHLLRDP